jgi:nitroreductase
MQSEGTMTYEEAVRATFRHAAATPEDRRALLQELVRYATLAPSSHNTQCWKFKLGGHAVSILPDLTRRCPAVDPDDHHLLASSGCAAENLVLAAEAFS